MSSRYGRNQKRKHREYIKYLQGELDKARGETTVQRMRADVAKENLAVACRSLEPHIAKMLGAK